MHVDFRAARGQVTQQAGQARLRHRSGPGEAEHGIRKLEAGAAGTAAEQRHPRGGDMARPSSRRGLHLGQHRARLARHAQRAQAVTSADRDRLTADRRMQMEMLVRVDVIERESGRAIGFELRLDFRRDLAADRRAREYLESETAPGRDGNGRFRRRDRARLAAAGSAGLPPARGAGRHAIATAGARAQSHPAPRERRPSGSQR